MFQIDKQKFGAFIAALRKEKGFTQRELAEQLFISDKAVSKWETGNSLPDTPLLIPLSDLLGVSVTKLLLCEKIAQEKTLAPNKVENLVKTAITYANEHPQRAYQVNRRWVVLYAVSLLVGCIGFAANVLTKQLCLGNLQTIMLLSALFGAYFCCFVKTKLPVRYDEDEIALFHDGVFSLHLPGIKLNNRNWAYILRTARISLCLCLCLFPIINFIAVRTAPNQWTAVGNIVLLLLFLGIFFIPMYWVGKKHES